MTNKNNKTKLKQEKGEEERGKKRKEKGKEENEIAVSRANRFNLGQGWKIKQNNFEKPKNKTCKSDWKASVNAQTDVMSNKLKNES